MGGGSSPCASCKLLRRRCAKDCIFAPYFPPDDPHKFAIVHKVFGASNVSKMLQELGVHERADAVSSLVYEANARMRDPVYGCVGAISYLQNQVSQLQMQLAVAQTEILCIQMQQQQQQEEEPLTIPTAAAASSQIFDLHQDDEKTPSSSSLHLLSSSNQNNNFNINTTTTTINNNSNSLQQYQYLAAAAAAFASSGNNVIPDHHHPKRESLWT